MLSYFENESMGNNLFLEELKVEFVYTLTVWLNFLVKPCIHMSGKNGTIAFAFEIT